MKNQQNLLISVDVEADGPCPGLYSMVSFGAVVVENSLDRTFYGETCPISENFIPEALAVSGFSREQHLQFKTPKTTMSEFDKWLQSLGAARLTFISDNNGFDWQFINYYFHAYVGKNPFGFSSRRIGDIYSGLIGRMNGHTEWKKYRKTKHDHSPVNDAKGNAEAILEFDEKYRLFL